MGTKPVVFVGSSSEGLRIAEAIQLNLDEDCDVLMWNQGAFEINKTFIESLVELAKVDFAILVLTADDVAMSRGKKRESPRDNVLFELGLFIGALGRERSFFVSDASKDLKIPTDLLGVAAPKYRLQASGNLEGSLGPVCTRIRRQIEKLGPRAKLDPAAVAAQLKIYDFSTRAVGWWWSFRHWDAETIGVIELSHDPTAGGIRMSGRGYGMEGDLAAEWGSKATCIHLDDLKMYYYWEGWIPATRAGSHKKFQGFGEISFPGSKSLFRTAVGVFSERPLADIKSTNMKSSEYRRCTAREVTVISDGDPERIAALVRRKLKR